MNLKVPGASLIIQLLTQLARLAGCYSGHINLLSLIRCSPTSASIASSLSSDDTSSLRQSTRLVGCLFRRTTALLLVFIFWSYPSGFWCWRMSLRHTTQLARLPSCSVCRTSLRQFPASDIYPSLVSCVRLQSCHSKSPISPSPHENSRGRLTP